jgi:Kdo2-lipid IVA lauroyltransferase/acyltransferase
VKNFRYFFETLAVKSLARWVQTLPRHGVLLFARLVGWLGYLVDYRGRDAALDNLICVFPELGWLERHRLICRSYQGFARTFVDLFWFGQMDASELDRHFVFDLHDPDGLDRLRASGGVWVTPHFGNFELISLVWGWVGLRFTIIAQDFKNPSLTDIFTAARAVSGHQMISQQSAMLRLTKALARKGNAAFLTDLNVKPGRAATVIDCFGKATCVTTLHVMLAQRLKLPIQPMLCLPLDDGRYVVRMFRSIEVAADGAIPELTQRCWDIFEAEIREQPHLWMWMYKHWRYLPSAAVAADYPSYANVNKAFAKLGGWGKAE